MWRTKMTYHVWRSYIAESLPQNKGSVNLRKLLMTSQVFPDSTLAVWKLPCLNLLKTMEIRYCYLHPIDEKITAQKCKFPTITQVVGSKANLFSILLNYLVLNSLSSEFFLFREAGNQNEKINLWIIVSFIWNCWYVDS